MKNELLIIIVGIIFVFSISFLIYNSQNPNLTGQVIFEEDNDSNNNVSSSNETFNNNLKTTKEDVLLAIDESEDVIKEMEDNNFSTLYVNDVLLEAKRVFEQARYAQILREKETSNANDVSKAKKALEFINWEIIFYEDVLIYTNDIKNRREKAYLIKDKLSVEENKMLNEKFSDETIQTLEQAKIAFIEDRYEETEILLERFRAEVEQERIDLSTVSGLRKGAKNFFQRYWAYIIVIIITLGVGGYFTYKKFEKKLLRKKIRRMKAEKIILLNLMKKAQEERFKKNVISELVYDIRMKKYQEKSQKIRQELPVLESRLNKLIHKKKGVKK